MNIQKRKYVRWLDADGKVVTAGTPGAVKEVRESELYYLRLNRQWEPLAPTMAQSKEMATKLLGDTALKRSGLFDAAEGHADTPLGDHVRDYRSALEAKRRQADYVGTVLARVESVSRSCGWSWLADLDASAAERSIAALAQAEPPKPLPAPPRGGWTVPKLAAEFGISAQGVHKRAQSLGLAGSSARGKARKYTAEEARRLADAGRAGLSEQTVNHYRKALVMFGNWLLAEGRLVKNPFAKLTPLEVVNQVHARDALSGEECGRILAAALASTSTLRGQTGPARYWLYRVALVTTLRARALFALTPAQFHLGGPSPFVAVQRGQIKTKKAGSRPIPPSMAAGLAGFLKGLPPGEPVWPVRGKGTAPKILRADMRAAGVPWRRTLDDGSPAVIDFHALRHTGLTLASFHLDMRLVQELAGHASPAMTARYVHPDQARLAAGVAGFGDALLPTPCDHIVTHTGDHK